MLEEPCDILAPCATQGVINAENAPRIRAKIIVEGANGPTTYAAHQVLDYKYLFYMKGIPYIYHGLYVFLFI